MIYGKCGIVFILAVILLVSHSQSNDIGPNYVTPFRIDDYYQQWSKLISQQRTINMSSYTHNSHRLQSEEICQQYSNSIRSQTFTYHNYCPFYLYILGGNEQTAKQVKKWKQQISNTISNNTISNNINSNNNSDNINSNNKNITNIKNETDQTQNRQNEPLTVLIVSGMHGNQLIGPFSLLNMIKYVYKQNKNGLNGNNDLTIQDVLKSQPASQNNQQNALKSLLSSLIISDKIRLIIMPIANPSGFMRQQRLTYPGRIDLNRDYPIDGNEICYLTRGTLIIDQIYRHFQIDITISLHSGVNAIAYGWGTTGQQAVWEQQAVNGNRQETSQSLNTLNRPYPSLSPSQLKLLQGLTESMSGAAGGIPHLNYAPYRIGPMKKVVYPATGTFEDWAYGASWLSKDVKGAPKGCRGQQYQPYPSNMMNGIVLLIQSGPQQTNLAEMGTPFGIANGIITANSVNIGSNGQVGLPQGNHSSESSNGHITRTIRALIALFEYTRPKLQLLVEREKGIWIRGVGCQTAHIKSLKVYIIPNKVNSKLIAHRQLLISIDQDSKHCIECTMSSLLPNALSQWKLIPWQINLEPEGQSKSQGEQSVGIKDKSQVFQYQILATFDSYNPHQQHPCSSTIHLIHQQKLNTFSLLQQKRRKPITISGFIKQTQSMKTVAKRNLGDILIDHYFLFVICYLLFIAMIEAICVLFIVALFKIHKALTHTQSMNEEGQVEWAQTGITHELERTQNQAHSETVMIH